jgi:HemY protein
VKLLRLLRYTLVLAIIVTAAVWLAENPGSVQVDWMDWRLDTSMAALLGLLGLAILALVILLRLWRAIRSFPAGWLERRRQRRREQGFQALSDGLAAVAGGQAGQARKLAGKAEKLLQNPQLTSLLAAQSAELNKDDTALGQHYQILQQRPETALAGLKGLFELALRQKDRDAAISHGLAARKLAPTDADLAEQLLTLLVEARRLGEAQDLVIEAGRLKAFDKVRTNHLRALLINEKAREAEQQDDAADALALAKLAVSHDPGFADAALRLARLQSAQSLGRQAAATLEKAWRSQPLPELGAAYAGLVSGEAPLQTLRRLDKLALSHPDHPVTLLLLGRCAMEAKLWGQARKYLTDASLPKTATLLGLLARLEIGEYNNQPAAKAWLATTPEPETDWLCRSCAHHSARWSLLCPSCGTLDSLAYQPPPSARNSAT